MNIFRTITSLNFCCKRAVQFLTCVKQKAQRQHVWLILECVCFQQLENYRFKLWHSKKNCSVMWSRMDVECCILCTNSPIMCGWKILVQPANKSGNKGSQRLECPFCAVPECDDRWQYIQTKSVYILTLKFHLFSLGTCVFKHANCSLLMWITLTKCD